MLSLHQLRCFLATYEQGSLTAAAEELGYAQPSVSEQIRGLEQTLGVQLFRRVGRGVIPTTVADTLRPHAERTLAAAEGTRLAAQQVRRIETGTIRFGMFGVARLYAGADLVADVLERHPGVRVELIGQNSSEVHEDLRRGRLEAAMIAMPSVTSEGMEVRPVARDEVVYVSADPTHLERPVTARRLAEAQLVMPDTSWRHDDSVRTLLRQMLHGTGLNPTTRIEVEDPEIAVELMGRGYGDTVLPRGAAEVLLPRLAPHAGYVSLRPRLYDYFAVVHRAGAVLSPAAQLMIELATARIQRIAEPL
ncbi:LysR family transcriptional regulator [Nocardioides sp. 503]|uniref:LysR family transcriptional regulator n=1 Tax=Nocardioides sp. 503 TaxID=2508326 RepID=UPI00106FDAD4|nr:LysR family transcriptional regulator [Nocardioides sp. 503]